MRRNLRRVRKEDFERIVLTETCPYEVPIIFSNFGLYSQLKALKNNKFNFPELFKYLLHKDADSYTIPLSYKIRKDEDSFRTLSLLHPAVQAEFVEFYKAFDLQILSACCKSNFSIRAPKKVASKYYVKNKQQDIQEFKSNQVSLYRSEFKNKFLTSYFSYRGYTRLHKFFDSYEFLDLERKYSSFWSLDISKCFDSIYTHSLTWALKTKPFSKKHRNIDNTLGSIFDRLMQSSNYNETAGIVIGPEVCRIFAEIIFQEIDREVESKLEEGGLKFGFHYEIKRYVDDIFIFSKKEAHSEQIALVIESVIERYNLYLNRTKAIKAAKPFVTQKTKSIRSIKKILQELKDNLVHVVPNTELGVDKWSPKRVRNKKRLIIDFVNGVKSSCIDDQQSYSMACGFLITSLTNLLIVFSKKNIDKDLSEKPFREYEDFYSIVIELIFHFFTIIPSHRGAVNICKLTYMSCEFFSKHYVDEANFVKSLIYTMSLSFFRSSGFANLKSGSDGFALLESLNLLLAIKELGPNFLLTTEDLTNIINISSSRDFSYFEIIAILFYIEDMQNYARIKKTVENKIRDNLEDLRDVKENTFKAYLLMDAIKCPFVSEKLKNKILERYFKQVYSRNANSQELLEAKSDFQKSQWFVSWDRTALLNSLEKKELLRGY
ncbi:antiviral reverse transcriptase Drt3b [Phytohalomonas tamaricis]|uniref:antiviral reverse transcriptase Drt3b n=1 Tax=Phytohalomonas tamaricis TaxID=2081032 RepID=UPI00131A0A31|nr:antiviral reverse transcriptase Drt3b [Phytohalomonas tamaricis]